MRATASAALALLLGACAAATRPADPAAPRPGEPRFIVLASSDARRKAALANWTKLVGAQASAVAPELRPVTATLDALPANLATAPRLPEVVITDPQERSEEELRESLRRFIESAAPLLGVALRELSLVEIADAPGGAKRASYRQNPFPFPLRNGYGSLEITFTPDLRVVGLSSTAVPSTDQLRRALAGLTQRVTAEAAVASLSNRPVTFADASGVTQTRAASASDAVTAREMVVFPVRSAGDERIELHLAWEISVGGSQGAPLLVYVDAVTGEQLGAAPAQTN